MDDTLVSVGALHALIYCERLFYLEEVERIRVADASVFAGRRLHAELERDHGEDDGEVVRLSFESDRLGLRGAVDVLQRRDRSYVPYEHKRGRAAGRPGGREAWQSDRIQIGAYCMLVEDAHNERVVEGRVRYHQDNVTVRVPLDGTLRQEVLRAVARARQLRTTTERPPVTTNERLCVKCSLAPVCLPEEARLAADPTFRPIRLLPPHPDRKAVHVSGPGARVGRSAGELVITAEDGSKTNVPIQEVGSVVVHGMCQVTTQALRLCADHDVVVHWMTMGGGLTGTMGPCVQTSQRHIRQFGALSDASIRLGLAKRLVAAKLENQLRFLLRATRGAERAEAIESAVAGVRQMLRRSAHAASPEELLGFEGAGAAAYFGALPALIAADVADSMKPAGRSRMPPADRFNALLSYAYGMLYREVLGGILAVGLHPGFGFYHRPRSAAQTLALDIMELFRVVLVDLPIVAAVNRRTFDPSADFIEVPGGFGLTERGRRSIIELFERRKQDTWQHSAVGYSLSYARIVELEVRLLEKEWTGEGGLFAKLRIR